MSIIEHGKALSFKIFGAPHQEEIGVEITGLPIGAILRFDKLQDFVSRRAPGQNSFSSKRKEDDLVCLESGSHASDFSFVISSKTLVLKVKNTDVDSSAYAQFNKTPRPGHVDLIALSKYGLDFDLSGGNVFSGRMTVALTLVGGILMQFLEANNIFIGAHVYTVASTQDIGFNDLPLSPPLFNKIKEKSFPVYSDLAGLSQQKLIEEARVEGDSLGGIVEFGILGLPVGLGGPLFEGLESVLSRLLFAIPGAKGVEFGSGFESSTQKGSENNDPFILRDKSIVTESNNHGGLLGGMASGMPVLGKVAFKPTPSISIPQRTVNLETQEEVTLTIEGRHDPCYVPRAVPVVEAALAIGLYNLLASAPETESPVSSPPYTCKEESGELPTDISLEATHTTAESLFDKPAFDSELNMPPGQGKKSAPPRGVSNPPRGVSKDTLGSLVDNIYKKENSDESI